MLMCIKRRGGPGGQFHQHFTCTFFHRKICSKPNSEQRKAAQKTFVRKMRTQIVDEIDTKNIVPLTQKM
jgi:hypothetical protein